MDVSLKDSLLLRARHNLAANAEIADVLSRLTDRARNRDAGSWFGSLMGIQNHVIVGDLMWLRRYRALSPDSPVLGDPRLSPPGLSWTESLHADFASWAEDRAYVDGRIIDWFGEFPEGRYGDEFAYADSRGDERRAVAAAAFDFLFVHQCHHRGQVAQILDEIGLPNNPADNGVFLEKL